MRGSGSLAPPVPSPAMTPTIRQLDPDDPRLKHEQVADVIRESIENGTYGPGRLDELAETLDGPSGPLT
jgi:hypothetical protein